MTIGTARAARPRDLQARERLRRAQQRESQALAAVCTAQRALDRAQGKRQAALAAADAVVEQAQTVVTDAQAGLVAVSGLERAAVLLGLDPGELRKTSSARAERRAQR